MGTREIFDLRVLPGRVALQWYNSYSGIIVKTPKATVIFDPVRVKLEDYVEADVIAVTHEHLDHFAPEIVKELQEKTGALVVTTPFISQRLPEMKTVSFTEGDSFTFKDVELHAERCDHPANQPLSFLISTDSGITIYHPSDSEPFPEMAELKRKYAPDILLYFATSLQGASQIAKLVDPQVVTSYYVGAEWQKRFMEEMEREVPETKIKLIEQLEIYQYPPSPC